MLSTEEQEKKDVERVELIALYASNVVLLKTLGLNENATEE
jgi:hypothetical protein